MRYPTVRHPPHPHPTTNLSKKLRLLAGCLESNRKMMVYFRRASLPLISFILYTIVGYNLTSSSHLVCAELNEVTDNNIDTASCDGDDYYCAQQIPMKESKLCQSSSSDNRQKIQRSLDHYYSRGMSAQAYKPDSPMKKHVCEANDVDDSNLHNVAHWPFWRSSYSNVVPVVVHANIYSCGGGGHPSTDTTTMTMEVWQPRPDGTFSSLRTGIEEGECRANVPISTKTNDDFSNIIGQARFETLVPGSSGVLGGLIPNTSKDYPPYGPGIIHVYLNAKGYYPVLGQLNMNELDDWLLNKESRRFRFRGSDFRPQANANNIDAGSSSGGGIEIQSAKTTRQLSLEVDVFIVPLEQIDGEETTQSTSLSDVFCTSRGLLNWIVSGFFKEPIAVCFPSLLDFFQL